MRYSTLFIVLVLVSCATKNSFVGKVFEYSDDYRVMKLTFRNDTIAVLNHTFYCEHLDTKFKFMQDTMTYRIDKERIFVTNLECSSSKCEYPLIKEIPILKDSTCLFLGKAFRKDKHVFDGRSYKSEFKKYGSVPNIDIDTLVYTQNNIFLYKSNGAENIGFKLTLLDE